MAKIILFTCSKEKSYTRNEAILETLCLNPKFKVIVATSNSKHYFSRILQIYGKTLFIRLKYHPDLIFVGFLSQPLLPFVKTLFPKTPLLADGFISVHDALITDRKLIPKNSLLAKIIFRSEQLIFGIPQKIIFDTKSHCNHIKKQFKLSPKKIDHLYLLASLNRFDNKPFFPQTTKFKIFYYSTFLPIHGVDTIVKTAKILSPRKNIRFTIVGYGQEKNKIVKLIKAYKLKNIKLIDWIDYDHLPGEISKHHLCLAGHFSSNPKTKWVIPGKAYQFALMKKPTILSCSPANKELFSDMEDAIFCQPNNPKNLAKKIVFAQNNRKMIDKIGRSGYQTIKQILGQSTIKLNKLIDSEIR